MILKQSNCDDPSLFHIQKDTEKVSFFLSISFFHYAEFIVVFLIPSPDSVTMSIFY